MYTLYGIYVNYTPNPYTGHSDEEEIKEPLATFDTLEQAEKYIEKSKLKKPKRESYRTDKCFKADSLLRYYTYAEVEEDFPLLHNPEI